MSNNINSNNITFNNLLRNYFKTKLITKIDDKTINVSSDSQSVFVDPTHISVVVQNGNATRVKTDTFSYLTDNVTLWCYVPLNYKNTFIRVLEEISDEISSDKDNEHLGSYYVSFNMNTPLTDGISQKVNGQDTVLIMLYGTVNYTKLNDSQFKDLSIEIDGVKLTNIISYTSQTSSLTEVVPIPGKVFADNMQNYVTIVRNVSVMMDSANSLHVLLRNMAEQFTHHGFQHGVGYVDSIYPLKRAVKVKSDNSISTPHIYDQFEEDCYLQVSRSVNSGFSTLDITITR